MGLQDFKSALTAHGLGGVDLLANEELLQLPDVHSGLGHGLQAPPPLGGTRVLRGALTWRRREQQRGAEVKRRLLSTGGFPNSEMSELS